MAVLEGSCLCGGVRFELSEDVERVVFCHCTTCKRLAGGVGTANARVPTDGIRVVEGRGLLTTYQPSEGTAKTFCSVCGSNLFGGGWPDSEVTSVRLPAIETPFDARPEAHGWVRSVAPWETLPDDGLPRNL